MFAGRRSTRSDGSRRASGRTTSCIKGRTTACAFASRWRETRPTALDRRARRPDDPAVDPYRLRTAGPADLPTVLDHRRKMFEQMGYTDPVALDAMIESSTPLLTRGLTDGSYRGWLVETGGEGGVAGGGVIGLEFQSHPVDARPRRAVVVNVFTEPAHRRRGLARRLMDEILCWAREEGLGSLYLHASNEARPLYETLGFEATGEMRLSIRSAP